MSSDSAVVFAELRSDTEYKVPAAGAAPQLLLFRAAWSAPSKQLETSLSASERLLPLHKSGAIACVAVDAERCEDTTEKFDVTSVPTVVAVGVDGKALGTVVGFDPAGVEKLAESVAVASGAASSSGPAAAAAPASASGATDPDALKRLLAVLSRSDIVLLMKGDPSEPKCGFSRKMVALLADADVKYDHFDILGDQGVRAAAKEHGRFPTFPQLWVKGTLIGGLDICTELKEDDALLDEISGALEAEGRGADASPEDLHMESLDGPADEAALRTLVAKHKVMLFMKGNPDDPQCGFSRRAVAVLKKHSVRYGSFNILGDERVRQGLKTTFNWKTYPQLYVNGSLIGGIDIMEEMDADDELTDAIPEDCRA